MSEEIHLITGTMVKDYMFCPTIFYYKHISRIYEPETEMMRSGKEAFKDIESKSKAWKTLLGRRRVKPDKVIYSAQVYSSKYDCSGIIDVVYWIGRKCNVVEIKESDLRKPDKSHIYQSAIYALMAEETFATNVSHIEIYYTLSDVYSRLRFSHGIRRYAKSILSKISRIMLGDEAPPPRFSRKCRTCWYRSICFP